MGTPDVLEFSLLLWLEVLRDVVGVVGKGTEFEGRLLWRGRWFILAVGVDKAMVSGFKARSRGSKQVRKRTRAEKGVYKGVDGLMTAVGACWA